MHIWAINLQQKNQEYPVWKGQYPQNWTATFKRIKLDYYIMYKNQLKMD